jgi:hypothetical protein
MLRRGSSEAVGLHREPPELGDELLLPKAQIEIANRKVSGNASHRMHITCILVASTAVKPLLLRQTDSAHKMRAYGYMGTKSRATRF